MILTSILLIPALKINILSENRKRKFTVRNFRTPAFRCGYKQIRQNTGTQFRQDRNNRNKKKHIIEKNQSSKRTKYRAPIYEMLALAQSFSQPKSRALMLKHHKSCTQSKEVTPSLKRRKYTNFRLSFPGKGLICFSALLLL